MNGGGGAIDYTGAEWDGITAASWTATTGEGENQVTTVNADGIDDSIDAVQSFINTMRTDAATLGTNMALIQVRQDFTKDMINTLKAGADSLTLADENEEAANLLALQTRQQLSQQALALATQSQQSILRLLG